MGKRGTRSLKTRLGREGSISRGGSDCTVEVYRSKESKEGNALQQPPQHGGAAPINNYLNMVVQSPTPCGLGQNGCWLS